MKNVFDFDVNKGKYDGDVFCAKEVSIEIAEKVGESYGELDAAIEKTQQSWISIIIELICMMFTIGAVGGIFKTGIKESASNAPLLFVVALVAALIWFLIFLRQRKKNKVAEKYLEENQVLESMNEMMEEVAKELGIPDDSIKVDVLADVYEIKRGAKKSLSQPVTDSGVVDMYTKGEFLCFADAVQEISIAIDDIVQIEKVKKRLSIGEWHKEEDYKSKKFKKYKIEQNIYGLLIKGYYSVQINSMWGAFEIRFPNYEEEAVMKIEKITGKSVLG